jgi:hypothetical protein
MVDVEQIKQILVKHFKITGKVSVDPNTGLVGVAGSVELVSKLDQLPVRFGQVSGNFWCHNNSLESLTGAPTQVGGDFYCNNNSLESLSGAPTQVGGNFNCSYNSLESLSGAPTRVGGNFNCSYNSLESLSGAPTQLGGNFNCSYNSLESLSGAPTQVGGEFWVDYTTSLPLLRLLQYNQTDIRNAPSHVTQIINKYAGTGKSHILLCSNELKKDGFGGNAAW